VLISALRVCIVGLLLLLLLLLLYYFAWLLVCLCWVLCCCNFVSCHSTIPHPRHIGGREKGGWKDGWTEWNEEGVSRWKFIYSVQILINGPSYGASGCGASTSDRPADTSDMPKVI